MPDDNDPQSIFNEPHLDSRAKTPDASEAEAGKTLGNEPRAHQTMAGTGQGVHEEPAIFPGSDQGLFLRDWSCSQCQANLRGRPVGAPCPKCGHRERYRPAPEGVTGYRSWLQDRIAATPERVGWCVALSAAVAGGVFSVIGALLEWWSVGPVAAGTICLTVIFGPAVEETLKVSVAAMLVERRPYLFQRATQIRLAVVGAALLFAMIENLLYLNLYLDAPTLGLRWWRWTACTTMHVACSAIAAGGVIAVWRRTTTQLRPPLLALGLRHLVIAIIVHSAYNAGAVIHQAL